MGSRLIKARCLIVNKLTEHMYTIRTNINQKHATTRPASFWTNIRLYVTPLIEANADAFEAIARMGQPFGGNVLGR